VAEASEPDAEALRLALEKAAFRYLERFDCSVQGLRRVLLKKARALWPNAATQAPVNESVEALLERYQNSGLLDDRRYAAAAIRGLRERGLGERAIVHRLAGKGVAVSIIEQALRSIDETSNQPELEAAQRFVKRRRLGAYRAGAQDAAARRKDLQALARAGFSYDTARHALGLAAHEDDEAF